MLQSREFLAASSSSSLFAAQPNPSSSHSSLSAINEWAVRIDSRGRNRNICESRPCPTGCIHFISLCRRYLRDTDPWHRHPSPLTCTITEQPRPGDYEAFHLQFLGSLKVPNSRGTSTVVSAIRAVRMARKKRKVKEVRRFEMQGECVCVRGFICVCVSQCERQLFLRDKEATAFGRAWKLDLIRMNEGKLHVCLCFWERCGVCRMTSSHNLGYPV